MTQLLLTVLSIFNVVMGLGIILGGIVGYRHGFRKTARDLEEQAQVIQDRVINALKSEIEMLQNRISTLEKENTRLLALVRLISSALKRRGLSVSIDGDLVSIEDDRTGRITQISTLDPPSAKE